MLTSKIITVIIENHHWFSVCANSCNKFVLSRSRYTIKLLTIILWKDASGHESRCPFWKGREEMPSSCPRSPASLFVAEPFEHTRAWGYAYETVAEHLRQSKITDYFFWYVSVNTHSFTASVNFLFKIILSLGRLYVQLSWIQGVSQLLKQSGSF